MKTTFNYDEYNAFEKTLGPIEERIIRDHFAVVVAGNDAFEDRSSVEMEDALWIFRHGWICARLALNSPKP